MFTINVNTKVQSKKIIQIKKWQKQQSTAAGFEPARACPTGIYAMIVIHRLNHSAKQPPKICIYDILLYRSVRKYTKRI